MLSCLLNIKIQVLLTVFLFCRYQRSVEWATQLLRRQGQDENTVHKILKDYTKPLEHPCIKRNEEVQLHDELNSEMLSKMEGTADGQNLSVMNGDGEKSDNMEDPSNQSDCRQESFRHDAQTIDGLDEHIVEVAASLPQVHCGRQNVLPQCGGQPENSSQRAGLICAGERGPDDEYVLVEEVMGDVNEREDTPNEEVSRRKYIISSKAICFWPIGDFG